jgi:DNA polymerase III delta prime subunit
MNKNTLLINKYKPTRFCDFLQEEWEPLIVFLEKQISSNKLLTLIVGDEETGKTTLLNTILREYYDTPFAAYHSNVLHLHYLKEQGASFYKNEVKYFCQTYCSLPGKKKTIVLDDLDFMTESNQTVFTNIIEKYANHVNFIASCKFLHKVLYGIQTRLMIVQLNRWTVPSLMRIANRIVAEEGMEFEPEAMTLLIQVAKYKVNRLINCMDKIKLVTKVPPRPATGGTGSATGGTWAVTGCTSDVTGCTSDVTGCTSDVTGGTDVATGCTGSATGCTGSATGCTGSATGCTGSATGCTDVATGCTIRITTEMVHQLCANIQYTVYKAYFTLIVEKRLKDAISVLYDLHDKGFSAIDILDNMFEYVKLITNPEEIGTETIADSVFSIPIPQIQVYQIIKVICKYITFFYNIHEDEIELALLSNDLISLVCI